MSDPLRIGLIAPIAGPVSGDSPSSIEQLVWLLCEELVRLGHEVTLFATGDSETSARLHATYAQGYKQDQELWDNWELHETLNAAAAFERADRFDVIHSHSYHHALPFGGLTPTPAVHTHHINPPADVRRACARRNAQMVAVSRYHLGKHRGIPRVELIHNGIDVGAFPFSTNGGDYLLSVGHLIPRKGVVEGIAAAREAGMRLVLAGKGSGEYFSEQVAPLIDGQGVEHVGPVSVAERNELLRGAAALLFPSAFAEPFGLVLVEAMACGTPVAALRRCAVPEIVVPGTSGFYASDPSGLAGCIRRAIELDRGRVRETAWRFDHRRMVERHQALYRRLARARHREQHPVAGAPA